ncbi:alpha-(1,3)-fucosyltransferase 7-like [Branchiostoma floridae]|uniref:Fucosyltransferase n=1 Tax=Branchiostoma floridae TaxID=7739 RepID=A0A9J7LZL5_BRAFL|nr:alpha-(1,3)-fucosyltransferase 7-like [Branchiostoma floridae]XP_035691977.1 alpha-(1,3)-fucosyltransferase 7-like [Branchiostoma floridae]
MELKHESLKLKICDRLLKLCFFLYIAFMAYSYVLTMPVSLNRLVGYNRTEVSQDGVENVSLIQRSALPRYDNFVPFEDSVNNQSTRAYKTWNAEASNLSLQKKEDNNKKIIIWTATERWPTPEAVPCRSMPQCEFIKITTKKKRRKMKTADADAIIFRGVLDIPGVYKRKHFPKTRPEHQIWIYFPYEPPTITRGWDLASYSGVFNWTMSYRNDSDILAPWGHITPLYKALAENPPPTNKDYAQEKSKLVIWYVTYCYKYLDRFSYAAELMQHIQVDVFGKCGNVSGSCKKDRQDLSCLRDHIRPYKFYLAFENFRCVEYITEKFWHNSLDYDVVPVVLGAPKGDYERVAPPNSFIHVDDFGSPEALANYLKYLDQNDDEYNRYFAWKTTPPKNLPDYESRFCEVCKKLLQVSRTERKVYTDLDRWWRGENYEFCQPVVWVDKHDAPRNAAHSPFLVSLGTDIIITSKRP